MSKKNPYSATEKQAILQELEMGQTLLLPLWGRAVETQKNNPLLIDKVAVSIVKDINLFNGGKKYK